MHGMKYTQVSADVFKHIQLGAGVVTSAFDVSSGAVTSTNIIGETSGGVDFVDEIEFSDFGEDIDNMPPNTKDLKRIDSRSATMSGTFIVLTPELARRLMAAADVDSNKITPRMTLKDEDFADVWWIGDYSDINTGDTAGYVAIHLMNSLNTNGFEIQSSNDGKGTFPFEFTGHYTLAEPDTVPYEVYVAAGTATPGV